MERALVTGASGLIGRHVAAALSRRGFDVHGCARTSTDVLTVNMHRCNLLDVDAMRSLIENVRPDVIVHCAWVTRHGAYWHSPENLDWLSSSVSLLRTAKLAGVRRFVGVGTCAEYEPSDNSAGHAAVAVGPPVTLYGTAKDALRRIGEKFAKVEGMEFAWARVFMLYGAGEHQDRLVASLARALVSGRPARMSSGAVVRDFLDARDVGAAVAALAASTLEDCVDIGSGHGVSLRSLAERLAALSGRPDLLIAGSLPDRQNESPMLIADATRLKTELGFCPSIELDTGLTDVLEYWRKRGEP